MKNILIIGASSKIAQEFIKILVLNGYNPILTARDLFKLQCIAKDIEIRLESPPLPFYELDISQTSSHLQIIHKILQNHSGIDGLFIAGGVMHEQAESEHIFNLCAETIFTNFTGLISIMNILAPHFENQNSGFISCISSVAGDRGRLSNFIYGSSKAGLNTYLEGLRCKLHKNHVLVQTVKPGPVDTPMTKGMQNLPFLALPQKVANDIYNGILKRKTVVYTPIIWKFIMSIIKYLPETLYLKLKL